MRPSNPLLLPLLATLTTALPTTSLQPTARSTASFTGRGRIRALWNQGDYADLGCLTAGGLWTTNNALCGTFTGTAITTSSLPTFKLSSSAGPCYIYGAQFKCEQGVAGYEFGIWPWPNSIPGKDCLRYGQYGLMASSGVGGPPAPGAAIDVHFVSYIEQGKYVWLTWAPV
ncbi:hypothetical protein F5144DRAFT_124211 [Chaetomium tenue]|uniref:Uncharacterized protein n=1 Tax=Chaetomium tenue TaxID=1854479 RepID=A0ACB7PGS3_9PEZI|nr:hypothetical protein F5144DRAFT_124211 [Chaetomium globosum]